MGKEASKRYSNCKGGVSEYDTYKITRTQILVYRYVLLRWAPYKVIVKAYHVYTRPDGLRIFKVVRGYSDELSDDSLEELVYNGTIYEGRVRCGEDYHTTYLFYKL